MKIYTKTGDKGSTSLVGGARVSKNDPRVHAYGTVDELISHLALLRAEAADDKYIDNIRRIQKTSCWPLLTSQQMQKEQKNLNTAMMERYSSLRNR